MAEIESIEELKRQRDEFKEAAYRLENTIRLLRIEKPQLFTALQQIARLSEEWKANHLGGVNIQRKRWERLGEIALSAIGKIES
jgi:transposase